MHFPTPSPSLILGIDGGGTQSRGVLATLQGQILRRAEAGPLNHHTTSVAHFRRSLRDLVAALMGPDLDPTSARLEAAVVGSAAFFDSASHEDRQQLLEGLLPLDRCLLVGDAVTALFGATRGRCGILVIAGTGSIAAMVDPAGMFHCHGGLGPLIESDPGSALWMAARAVRTAQRYFVESGELDDLGRDISRVLGFDQLTEAVLHLYAVPDSARQLARLAGHLAATASMSSSWRLIEDEAGAELARMALPLFVRLRRDLAATGAATVPPVFASGSVLSRNPRVRASLARHLTEAVNHPVVLSEPEGDAVEGALQLALRHAGLGSAALQGAGVGISTDARS